MNYTLIQWQQSNYEISTTLTDDDLVKFKDKVLRMFQKDITKPGFRKGHVPLDMVEEQVQPHYVSMGIFEEVITKVMRKIVEEKKDLQLIGQPYDLNPQQLDEAKDGVYTVTFKIDEYPQVNVKDNKREKLSLKTLVTKVTKKEQEEVLQNMKRQYADYKDVAKITDQTVTKVALTFIGAWGEQIDTWSAFIGKEDFAEFSVFKTLLVGKKQGDTQEIDYADDLPALLLYKKDKGTPTKVVLEVVDIKEQVLPTFDQPMIEKLFGKEAGMTTETDVLAKIEETLAEQKRQESLVKSIEELLGKASSSISVAIPKTLADEEVKSRLETMKQRFGGEEWFKEYIKQMGDEKAQAMMGELSQAAKDSLQKYFVFRKLTELLKLSDTINREKWLDAETKLYEHYTGESLTGKAITKAADKKPVEKKKTPAKKK